MLTEAEILKFIEDDKTSKKKQRARQGERYYGADHDIKNYRVYYVDADGKLREDTLRSNIKISHPFFTELVDQQVQYMLSGEGAFIRSDDEVLQGELDKYFGDDFRAELQECLTGCITKGFEHMYAYKAADMITHFMCVDSRGVVEVRAKDTDDGCEYVIYWYIDRMEKEHTEIKRIQVWDEKQVYYYVQQGSGALETDTSVGANPRPHITYKKDGDDALYYEGNGGYGFIPFFRLDNNRKQISGLKPVKDLIDDYDLMACGLSNNLQDVAEGIYVVKGFEGADLDEMINNIRVKKHVGVSADGGVDIKTIDIPYEARRVKLELDEKNIYRFGMGFNSAQLGDGNITNIVIKSRYALLDLKSNKLEIRLKQFLRKMIKVALDEINAGMKTDYGMDDVYIKFEREVMTNAQDNAQIGLLDAQKQGQLLDNIMVAANALDEDTVLKAICEVLDLDYEEIKGKLKDMDEEGKTRQLLETLGGVVPDESGGDLNEQPTA